MRITIAKLIGVLALAMLARASDQTFSFQATVPFDFQVGTRSLPAGTYIVQRRIGTRAKDETGVVVIRSNDGRFFESMITRLTDGSKPVEHSRMFFLQDQGKHYLAQICVAGDWVTHQVNLPSGASRHGSTDEVSLVRLR